MIDEYRGVALSETVRPRRINNKRGIFTATIQKMGNDVQKMGNDV